MKPGNSLWYIGLSILFVAGILTVFLQLVSYNHQKSIRKKAYRALAAESRHIMESDGLEGHENVSNQNVSPFFEDGFTMARRRVAPTSALGHGRIEVRALDEAPIENLDRTKLDKQD
eukprot:IDg12676t1